MRQSFTIAQLLPALNQGGVEQSTIETAAALTQAGHHALVISAGGTMLPQLAEAGGTHITLPIGKKSPSSLLLVPKLRALFRQHRVDLIHARSRLPAWLGHLARKRMATHERPHWVTTAHGLNSPSRYSRIMGSGERVICVSDSVAQHFTAFCPKLDASRIRIVERSMDPKRFDPTRTHDSTVLEPHRTQHPKVFAHPWMLLPGRGTRLKGHHVALHALAKLHQQGQPAGLVCLGAVQESRMAYIQELRQLAEQLGLADFVLFLPSSPHIADWMQAANLVLQCSIKPEAFGRTVIEALNLGTPVVGFDHGGVGELLARHFPEGRISAIADANALTHTCAKLLTQPVTPPPLNRDYSLARQQRQTLAVYHELLGGQT